MKIVFPPRAFVILGLACFVVGLLVILQENTLFGLVSQIAPNAESALIFGAVIISIGQAVVIFGFIKLNSSTIISNFQRERQLTTATFTNERQALMAHYTQTIAKLDQLLAIQKELNATPKQPQTITCKFCGTKTEKGTFCPNCGKAN